MLSDVGSTHEFMVGNKRGEVMIVPKGASGFLYQLKIDGMPIEQNFVGPIAERPLDIGSRPIQLVKTADGLGMTLRNNPFKTGCVVWTVEDGRAAWNAGLRVGDVVLSIEDHIVDGIDRLAEWVGEAEGGVVNMEVAGVGQSRQVATCPSDSLSLLCPLSSVLCPLLCPLSVLSPLPCPLPCPRICPLLCPRLSSHHLSHLASRLSWIRWRWSRRATSPSGSGCRSSCGVVSGVPPPLLSGVPPPAAGDVVRRRDRRDGARPQRLGGAVGHQGGRHDPLHWRRHSMLKVVAVLARPWAMAGLHGLLSQHPKARGCPPHS